MPEDSAEYDRGGMRVSLYRCPDCGVIRHALSRAGLPTNCEVCGTAKRKVMLS